MGREIRRVSLDFDWPLEKVWEGFQNPHFKPCPAAERGLCRNGETPAALWVGAVAQLIAMLGDEAVREPYAGEFQRRGQIVPHPYLENFAQAPRQDLPFAFLEKLHSEENRALRSRMLGEHLRAYPPKLMPLTEEMAEFVTGILGRRPTPPFSQNPEWDIYRKLLRIAGIKKESGWGRCKVCHGKGMHPESVDAYEAWKPTEPPKGPGWQLWETVSEGSPISPVFPTREALADYLVGEGYSRAAAEKFCKSGWAPSGVIAGGVLYENIESSVLQDPKP